ncbi:MAG: hypothetical protein NVSMB13_09260 [Mycobacteriales bacterium]
MTATARSDVETATVVVPPQPTEPGAADPGRPHRLSRLLVPGCAVALMVAVVLRFVCRSQLWLDEAQAVAIARAPLHTLLDSLRIDGSPPLYYLVLHGWMAVFGTGTWAVRALSGVFSVATLPLAWLLARRLVGRSEAVATVLLLASSPFAVHYATEARMYSLVMLLTAVGGLALLRVLERPGWWPVAGLGVCSGLLALTHYWAFYLLAVLGLGLLVAAWRDVPERRAGYRRGIVGLLSGGLLFVPWLPVFVFQALHTGAPWGVPTSAGRIVDTVLAWAGSGGLAGRTAGVLLLGLLALGVAGRPLDGRRIVIDLRGHRPGRELALLSFGTLAVGITLSGAPYALRYSAVAFVPFLLVVSLGLHSLPTSRQRDVTLALVVVLGLTGAVSDVLTSRTQAGQVATALRARIAPGDLVAYCPDQLGPSVSRLLPSGIDQVVFPTMGEPRIVNWVDYQERNRAAVVAPFAQQLQARAGAHTIWRVYADGYRTFSTKCTDLKDTLKQARPGNERVVKFRKVGEHMDLWRLPAGGAG